MNGGTNFRALHVVGAIKDEYFVESLELKCSKGVRCTCQNKEVLEEIAREIRF